ncbi:MAG: sortase [Candidatus Peribacteraceae bacterium]|nr:sortase [Candidatus Peribacteraceae bacterium]
MRLFRAAIVALLLTAAVPAAVAQTFSDATQTRYGDAYRYLWSRQAVEGFADRSGRPFATITRAEALKVAVEMRPAFRARAEWFRTALPPLPLFTDVDQTAWYAPYVEAGFEAGLLTGYEDFSFRPNAPIAAEEGIALLMRAYGLAATGQQVGEAWFTRAAAEAFARNIVDSSERLQAGDRLMRGQFFDMAYRLDVVEGRKLASFPETSPAVIVQVPREPVMLPPPIPSVSAVPYVPPSASSKALPPKIPPVSVPSPQPRPQAVSASSARAVVPPPPVQQPAVIPVAIPRFSSSSRPATVVPPVVPAQPKPPSTVASGKPFSLTIPTLGITDLTVTHPTDPATSKGLLSVLGDGVGHLFSYPGGEGKVLIYGHSSGYPWDVSKYTKIFRTVNQLNPGDKVYVTYRGTLYTYEVSYKETVPSGDMSRLSGQGAELILYTCWPPDSIKERYLVHAVPVSSVAAR